MSDFEYGPPLEKGAYVLATKYADGDPGDPWAVGYYLGTAPDGRHYVGDSEGKSFYRNGYRKVRAGLDEDVGHWLVTYCKELEKSPPGSVNLWTMLTDQAFNIMPDAPTVNTMGTVGEEKEQIEADHDGH